MRSDNAAIHANKEISPILIKSPRQQEADRLDDEHRQRIRAGIVAQLHRR